MKIFIQSIYENNYVCPVLQSYIFSKLPNVVNSINQADYVILAPSILNSKLNKKAFNIKKPYIIVDFLEYGMAWDSQKMPTHIIGKNTSEFEFSKQMPDWLEFDAFVKSKQPKLYFKRELKKSDYKDNIIPIEYPCKYKITAAAPKNEFIKRFIDIFFWWGFSHASRPALHAEIYKQSASRKFHILSDWNSYNQKFVTHVNNSSTKQVWAPFHIHHTSRVPMEQILNWQNRSKITVSLYGHGRKCFRHAECINTIMAKQDDGLSWSHPWKNNENCILLPENQEFEYLSNALNLNNLYEIYVKGQENLNHYFYLNYINNHVINQIKKFI